MDSSQKGSYKKICQKKEEWRSRRLGTVVPTQNHNSVLNFQTPARLQMLIDIIPPGSGDIAIKSLKYECSWSLSCLHTSCSLASTETRQTLDIDHSVPQLRGLVNLISDQELTRQDEEKVVRVAETWYCLGWVSLLTPDCNIFLGPSTHGRLTLPTSLTSLPFILGVSLSCTNPVLSLRLGGSKRTEEPLVLT